jgi:hypothetical protein
MANQWFRMYSEFATDAKVQMMSEVMQRRYLMLMCLRCSNTLVTLQDEEIAFQLRISNEELAETKALFVKKGFIDSAWNLLNWEKRQFASDSSRERVAKHRALQKEKQMQVGNDDVTLQKQQANGLDTDTDTEQNRKEEPNGSVGKADALPRCDTQSVVNLYHEVLPELPAVRVMNDARQKAVRSFWKFVLTSKKSDGTKRAETAEQALLWIGGYFDRARHNDFLMGRGSKAPGHEGWQCDFDFLLSEKGKKHVLEKTQVQT